MKFFRRAEPESVDVPDVSAEPQGSRTPVRTPLAARAGHRHLLATSNGLWAYYLMGPTSWQNRSVGERSAMLADATQRWSDLAGHRVWLRGTSNPFPHEMWAKRLDRATRSRRPSDDPIAEAAWVARLRATQLEMVALGARRSATVLGVRLSTDVYTDAATLAQLFATTPLPDSKSRLEELRCKLAKITTTVAERGFAARPLSAQHLGWLIHASAGMGAPVPTALLDGDRDGWEPSDMAGFTAPVYATAASYAPTTVVRSMRGSTQFTRHVAVLHADRIDPRDPLDPGLMPWLAHPQSLDDAVDFCAVFDVLEGHDLKDQAQLDRRRAKNLARHYNEHDQDAPAEIERGFAGARRTEDEITNGTKEIAARVRGVVMYAVTGDTEGQALDRAGALTRTTARDGKVTLTHDYGQYPNYRSFIPGEPAVLSGHITQMPCYALAAAVPNASTSAGDGRGFFVGPIAGGHDIFLLDAHGGPKKNTSGMALFTGNQGAGKSALAGALAEFEASCGRQVILNDPSGPMAKLVALPHLAKLARHIELASADPGVLNCYMLVPEPRQSDYSTLDKWRLAVAEADAERRELMIDCALMLMPVRMVAADAHGGMIPGTIEDAVTAVGGAYGTNPWAVVAKLETMGDLGRLIASRLRTAATMKSGRLIFPLHEAQEIPNSMWDSHLTVITMKGMSLPPKGLAREHWDRQQLMSLPVLHLSARLATRAMYADTSPKTIVVDEGGIITGGQSSFAPFMVRASFDSRKNNAFVCLLAQNANTLMELDPQIGNLAGMAVIGRMQDEASARAALPLLRLPEDSGYHQLLTGLRTGDFVIRDWAGTVRTVGVDRAHYTPDLLWALETNPGVTNPDEDTSDDEEVDLWSAV